MALRRLTPAEGSLEEQAVSLRSETTRSLVEAAAYRPGPGKL